MPMLQNKVNPQNVGYGSNIAPGTIKALTAEFPLTQGVRYTLANGENPFSIVLNSPGRKMIGVSVNIATIASIGDTFAKITVNGYSLIDTVNLLQLCPNYVYGMMFFSTPYVLVGNDQIKVNFTKNDAGNIVIGFNIHYLPQ